MIVPSLSLRVSQRIVAIRRADDRPAQMRDAAHAFARQTNDAAFDELLWQKESVETFADAVTFPPAIERGEHDGADHRVQAGRVAAAGANGNSFDGHARLGHFRISRSIG